MMLHERSDYTVRLPVFEGPLDVLLRLIERAELQVTSIALAQVADQYLAYVRAMEYPDPDALSSFLVLAAKLLVIKSCALLPRSEVAHVLDEVGDEGAALARQLREYQSFKQVATMLRGWDEEGRRSYMCVLPPVRSGVRMLDLLDVPVDELIVAVQRRMRLLLPVDVYDGTVPVPKVVTVPEMVERILGRLRFQEWIGFEDVLSLVVVRVEVVVAVWSVLELLKRWAVVVEQAQLFGPIMIGRGPNFDSAPLYDLVVDEGWANAPQG